MIEKMSESKRKEPKEKLDLELLIVEDDFVNTVAAHIYFQKIKEVKIDFATTYEEGKKKLEEKVYAGAIIDWHIPQSKGKSPEKVGFDLGKIAEKYAVDYIIFTGGIGHSGKPTVFIYPLGEKSMKKETKHPGKAESEAWGEAYKALQEIWYDADELFKTKLRYKKLTEKSYVKKD